jgi:hypothetical protein
VNYDFARVNYDFAQSCCLPSKMPEDSGIWRYGQPPKFEISHQSTEYNLAPMSCHIIDIFLLRKSTQTNPWATRGQWW